MRYIPLYLSLFFLPETRAEFFKEKRDPPNLKASTHFNLEKIQKISATKKIFIITNNKQSFGLGDFLTYLVDDIPVARFLCAKIEGKYAGTKVIKIYHHELWKTLEEGMKIQVLKGDDSSFKAFNATDVKNDDLKIQTKEDLFNDTILEEDLNESSRNIQNDNILSTLYGKINGFNNDGTKASYDHFNVAFSLHMKHNFWIDFSYGQNLIPDYPSSGLDTRLSNSSFKLKYSIAGPFFSFFMPYIGYQILSSSSPGAGRIDPQCLTECPNSTELDLEVLRVNQLEKNALIFGIIILKRLVPAWFVKINIGNDLIGGGLAFEF